MAKKVEYREIITKYRADASGLYKELRKIDESARQTANGMTSLNKKLGTGFKITGVAVAAQALLGLGKTAYSVVDSLVQISDELKLLNARFGYFAGNQSGLGKVVDLANSLGVSFEQVSESINVFAPGFLRLGKSFDDTVGFVNNLTQAFRVYGTNAQGAYRASYQLAQAFSSGRLYGEELRSLQENAGGLARELEQAVREMTGWTEPLIELGAAGKLTTDVLYEAFDKAFKAIEKDVKNFPQLIQFQKARVANAWKSVVSAFAQATKLDKIFLAALQKVEKLLYSFGLSLGSWFTDVGYEFVPTDLLEKQIADLRAVFDIDLYEKLNKAQFLSASQFKQLEKLRKELDVIINIQDELTKRATAAVPGTNLVGDPGALENTNKNLAEYAKLTERVLGLTQSQSARFRELLPTIDAVAKQYQISTDLLVALIKQESGFKKQALSPKGATGIMQIMPNTAKGIAKETGLAYEKIMTDAVTNIEAGAYYLTKRLKQLGGDAALALAAYNAGLGAVQKYKGIPPFAETQAYVPKILSDFKKLQAAQGDFSLSTQDLTKAWEKENEIAHEALLIRNQVAETIKGSKTAYDQLLGSLDPAVAAEQEYAAGVRVVNEALQYRTITAEQASKAIELLKAKMDEAAESSANFTEALQATAESNFNSWIDQAVDGTFKLADALRGLLKELAALATKWLVLQTVQKLGFDTGSLASAFGFATGAMFPRLALPQGVYSQPMPFSFDKVHRFAKGGVLGEAGPEAIIPLARMANGKLGVEAAPTQMNVNVKNYATGVEAVPRQVNPDTIEITIREIEGRIARGGNSTARVMENAYGLRRGIR